MEGSEGGASIGRPTVCGSSPGGTRREVDDSVTGRRLRAACVREEGVREIRLGFPEGTVEGRGLRKDVCDWWVLPKREVRTEIWERAEGLQRRNEPKTLC